MIHKTYEEFFRAAMGSAATGAPYPYQRSFATDTALHQFAVASRRAERNRDGQEPWAWRDIEVTVL